MAKKRADAEAGVVIWKGPGSLRPLLVPIELVYLDLANCNEHPEESIADIAGAYERFGQQKPIVVDRDNITRAGNGQLEAAKRLGWTHIAVSRSDLEGSELALFAIADNQVATKSRFNQSRLVETLRGASESGVGVDDLGWPPDQLRSLLERTSRPSPTAHRHGGGAVASTGAPELPDTGDTSAPPAIPEGRYREQYGVIVVCKDADEQREVYERLVGEGYDCRVVVT